MSCLKPQKEIFHQPHVLVELFGDFEEDKKTWSTNNKQNIQYNGYHPIWNKTLEPHLVANRDMAFLEFTLSEVSGNPTRCSFLIGDVYAQTNQFGDSSAIAFCTAKLSAMRNGVRSLTLQNDRGLKYPLAVILVDISILSSSEIQVMENDCKRGLQVSILNSKATKSAESILEIIFLNIMLTFFLCSNAGM